MFIAFPHGSEGIAMSRYQALAAFVVTCHLIGCTIVTVRDSKDTCIAVKTDTTDKAPFIKKAIDR